MTKAQEIYERVNALVAEGLSRPDAFRQLAKELGQKFDSIRGAYYTGRQQATGETGTAGRRPRKRETTPQDAVLAAVATLENAITAIEREVTAAAERALEAQAEHEALKANSGARIDEIRRKIAVLTDAEEEDA